MINYNELAIKIAAEPEIADKEQKFDLRVKFDLKFAVEWFFFTVVVLIPMFFSFLRKSNINSKWIDFFNNHQVLYVGFTLVLAILIGQVQQIGFKYRHYFLLMVLFLGFGLYLLLDSEISFGIFSGENNLLLAKTNICYLIFAILFSLFNPGFDAVCKIISMIKGEK
jgi:hypothetical protein